MDIALKVNQNRLMKNLKVAFSNRFTVLSELMQNARRAGASKVEFSYNEQTNTLTVTDDGCGIDDFQNLLTVADSGWSQDVQESDQPYGMGFASALFAAESITVSSLGKKVALNSKDTLVGHSATVEDSPEAPETGAEIALHGLRMTVKDVNDSLKKLSRGFPLPVSLEGEVFERPYALDSGRHFMKSDIGMVSICGLNEPAVSHEVVTRYFLQGIELNRSGSRYGFYSGYANIIHLDSTRFTGRMPDRDSLVDEEISLQVINEEISKRWREFLEGQFKAMTPEAFAEAHLQAANLHAEHLVSALPFIPKSFLGVVEDYPLIQHSDGTTLAECKAHLYRQDIEGGQVLLADRLDDVWIDGENVEAWMYCRAAKAYVLAKNLPKGHWAEKHVVNIQEKEPDTPRAIKVVPVNILKEGYFSGRWAYASVVLCEKYRIEIEGLPTVEIHDEAIYSERGFLFPAKETCGDVVQQSTSYTNEYDEFAEGDRYEDGEDLSMYVKHLRCEDPAMILQELIGRVGGLKQIEALLGKTFAVSIDLSGKPAVSLAA